MSLLKIPESLNHERTSEAQTNVNVSRDVGQNVSSVQSSPGMNPDGGSHKSAS